MAWSSSPNGGKGGKKGPNTNGKKSKNKFKQNGGPRDIDEELRGKRQLILKYDTLAPEPQLSAPVRHSNSV